jgi:Rho termination factor, N-terminal domain
VNKSELESKHLSELHALAAEAGVERYRMLPRAELIEKLAGGGGNGSAKPKGEGGGREPGRRKRGGRGGGGDRSRGGDRPRGGGDRPRGGGDRPRGGGDRPRGERRERKPREERKPRQEPKPEPREEKPQSPPAAGGERPKRKRRRRWGRRRKGVRVHDLLLPPSQGGRAIVYADSRAACTALLRELAAELGGESKGPDPIALLVDPSPEELAEWKREAPRAEIVSAGQARHADDALAQATRRAASGEDVIVLIDSLTRFAEDFAGPDEARDLFDAGQSATGGTLTVVAALERPS